MDWKQSVEWTDTTAKPKAEWFGAPFDGEGNPTGKWDARWVGSVGSGIIECVEWPHVWLLLENGETTDIDMEVVDVCAPVTREGRAHSREARETR